VLTAFAGLLLNALHLFNKTNSKNMKTMIGFCICLLLACSIRAQSKTNTPLKKDTTKKVQVVETACGQCQLGLPGKGCSLAVRINGKAYFVDGTDIDSHGDAHASDGFCNAIRKAEVQGKVMNNRYRVTWFQLLNNTPDTPKGKKE
jgi:hypothetical protein